MFDPSQECITAKRDITTYYVASGTLGPVKSEMSACTMLAYAVGQLRSPYLSVPHCVQHGNVGCRATCGCRSNKCLASASEFHGRWTFQASQVAHSAYSVPLYLSHIAVGIPINSYLRQETVTRVIGKVVSEMVLVSGRTRLKMLRFIVRVGRRITLFVPRSMCKAGLVSFRLVWSEGMIFCDTLR